MFGVRGIDWNQQPLGERSDYEIAESLGVHRTTVREARLRRGIRRVRAYDRCAHTPDEWETDTLGRVPDAVLAGARGCTVAAIAQQRRVRNIPPARALLTARPAYEMLPHWVSYEDMDTLFGRASHMHRAHRLGITRHTRGWQPKPKPQAAKKCAVDLDDVDWSWSDGTIAYDLGVWPSYIQRARKARGRPEPTRARVWVYAMRNPAGRVKIGKSDNPHARAARIASAAGTSIELLGVEPGGGRRERELHARHAAVRTDGEWFEPTPEVLAWVSTLAPPSEPPGPPLA